MIVNLRIINRQQTISQDILKMQQYLHLYIKWIKLRILKRNYYLIEKEMRFYKNQRTQLQLRKYSELLYGMKHYIKRGQEQFKI